MNHRFDGDPTIRTALPADLEQMLTLADDRRREYSKYQPIFWHPAPDAISLQRSYFEGLIAEESVITLVEVSGGKLLGFVIANLVQAPTVYEPGGLTCSVDDFAVAKPGAWATTGVALLERVKQEAQQRGAVQLVVVCGHLDEAKRSVLADCQMSVASEWWVASL